MQDYLLILAHIGIETYRKIPSSSPGIIEACKHLLVDISEYRGSIYALSIFIHYPSYTQRIPNVGLGIILRGLLFRRIFWIGLHRPMFGWLVFWGGLYFGFCST